MDPYHILEISPDAPSKEVTAAFRRMAMRWHPDRHQEGGKPQAELRFKEINAAYVLLSDPARRHAYDAQKKKPGRTRTHRPKDQRNPAPQPATTTSVRRGADIKITLTIPLNKAIHGGRVHFSLQEGINSQHVEESRSESEACAYCSGLGMLSARTFCQRCAGRGYIRSGIRVTGRLHAAQETTVFLPKHVAEGSVIKLREMGKPGEGGSLNGDLLVKIKIAPPPGWKIKGADLFGSIAVARELLHAGGEIRISFPTGTTEAFTLQPGTTELNFGGKGLYDVNTRSYGNIYIQLRTGKNEVVARQPQ